MYIIVTVLSIKKEKLSDKKGPISFADINKSIEMLNYGPITDINEGIPRITTWYKDYYKM